MIRSCLKKQPRGVFTFTGNRYDDGRRDLRLSIEEHFLEQIEAFNGIVFDNGRRHTVRRADVFALRPRGVDLVYLDPPYVPRSDDNCYVKRYHFLEGLSCYWRGLDIMNETKVKKIAKPFTPFSYRRTAIDGLRPNVPSVSQLAQSCSRTARTVSPTKRFLRRCCAGTRRRLLPMRSPTAITSAPTAESNVPR